MTNNIQPFVLNENTVTAAVHALEQTTGIKVGNLFGQTHFDLKNPTIQNRLIEITNLIDVRNADCVSNVGKDLGTITAGYTEELLSQVKNSDLDEIGNTLTTLITETRSFQSSAVLIDNEKSNFPIIGGLIDKFCNRRENNAIQKASPEESIGRIQKDINNRKLGLQSRVKTLDSMFNGVLKEADEIGFYIVGAQIHLVQLREQLAQLSGMNTDGSDQRIVQEVYDLNNTVIALEKRITDLYLLQQSNFQTLPQIRLVQNNNIQLVQQFNMVQTVTIPAWRRSYAMAISVKEQQQSIELIDNIHNHTQKLMRDTADQLHINSIKTAQANQRTAIDVETLEYVQDKLNLTVSGVLEVQRKGVEQTDSMLQQLQKRNLFHDAIKNNLAIDMSNDQNIDATVFNSFHNHHIETKDSEHKDGESGTQFSNGFRAEPQSIHKSSKKFASDTSSDGSDSFGAD